MFADEIKFDLKADDLFQSLFFTNKKSRKR